MKVVWSFVGTILLMLENCFATDIPSLFRDMSLAVAENNAQKAKEILKTAHAINATTYGAGLGPVDADYTVYHLLQSCWELLDSPSNDSEDALFFCVDKNDLASIKEMLLSADVANRFVALKKMSNSCIPGDLFPILQDIAEHDSFVFVGRIPRVWEGMGPMPLGYFDHAFVAPLRAMAAHILEMPLELLQENVQEYGLHRLALRYATGDAQERNDILFVLGELDVEISAEQLDHALDKAGLEANDLLKMKEAYNKGRTRRSRK